ERGRPKRCKWASVHARLNANPSQPALLSIFLSNDCFLENKLDYIRLQRREFRDCCVFVFTETWLSNSVPEAAIQLDVLTVFRADRNTALCGKTRGDGMCGYINKEWCKNSVLVSRYCSSLVEKTLCRVNPRKSAGPDNIPGRVLRECAEQLAVFTDIFNISLLCSHVPQNND
ncbi:hypothetical protein C0J45_23081, partial [Silurus meridionalis]